MASPFGNLFGSTAAGTAVPPWQSPQHTQTPYYPPLPNIPLAPAPSYPVVEGAEVKMPLSAFNELTKQAFDARKARRQMAERLVDALKRMEAVQDNKPLPLAAIAAIVEEWARDGA